MMVSTPPMENTHGCPPSNSRLIAVAPSPMGRIKVATPAPNTTVAGTTPPRCRKPVARYAGSITDTQHGASSATVPPRNEASSVVPTSSSPTGLASTYMFYVRR